jgi:hypothetical protein
MLIKKLPIDFTKVKVFGKRVWQGKINGFEFKAGGFRSDLQSV